MSVNFKQLLANLLRKIPTSDRVINQAQRTSGNFSNSLRNLVNRKAIDPILRYDQRHPIKLPTVFDTPKFNFTEKYIRPMTSEIRNPYARMAVEFVPGMAESLMNTPSNLVQATARTARNYYNVGRGKEVSNQQILSDMSPAIESTLNLMGLNPAKQLVKKTTLPFLKQVPKMMAEGGLFGAGYGLSGGLQENVNAPSVKQQLLRSVPGVVTNAAMGAVLAPTIHGGKKLFGKGLEKYRNIPEKKAGFVTVGGEKTGELGQVKRLSVPELKKLYERKETKEWAREIFDEFMRKEFGKKYNPELARQTFDKAVGMAKSEKDLGERMVTAIAAMKQKAGQPFSVIEMLKSFNKEWKLYKDRVPPVPSETEFGVRQPEVPVKPGEISSPQPLTTVKGVTEGKLSPPIKEPRVEGFNRPPEVQKVFDELGISTKEPAVEIPQPKRQSLLQQLSPKKGTKDQFEASEKIRNDAGLIESRIRGLQRVIEGKQLDPDIVAKVVDDRMEPPDANYKDFKDIYKSVRDEIHEVMKVTNPDLPKREFGMAHAWEKEAASTMTYLREMFGNHWLFNDFLNPHTLKRGGEGKGYITDPVEALRTEWQSAVTEYHQFKPPEVKSFIQRLLTDKKKEINVVKELENLTKGTKEHPIRKKVINTKAAIGGIFREINTHIMRLKEVAPKLVERYREIADYKSWEENSPVYEEMKLRRELGPEKLVSWFANKLKLVGEERAKFISVSMTDIKKNGIDPYSKATASFLFRKLPIMKFMDEVGKYKITDPGMQTRLNNFIREMIRLDNVKTKLELRARDLSTVFSWAHIMGNVKVGLLQPGEIFRMANIEMFGQEKGIHFPKYTIGGILKNLSPKKFMEYQKKYNLPKGGSSYERMVREGEQRTLITKANEKMGIGYIMVQKAEQYKNGVFAYAFEQLGKEKGLKGRPLTDFVNDNVRKFSLEANKFCTPEIFKNDYANLALQYGQYAIKKAGLHLDTIQAKNWKLEFGLVLADAMQTAYMMALIGLPAKKFVQGFLQQLLPVSQRSQGGLNIPLGPIFTVTADIYDTTKQAIENYQNDKSMAGVFRKTRKLAVGNFVPIGAQINKTYGVGDIINKGYYDAPSGNVGYMSPDTKIQQLRGLLFGTTALPQYQDWENRGFDTLSENQSELIKSLSLQDRGMANTEFDRIMNKQVMDKQQKRTIADMLGNRQLSITTPQIGGVPSYGSVTNNMGYSSTVPGAVDTDPTLTRNVQQYQGGGTAGETTGGSIYDILNRNAEKERIRSQISTVMTGDEYTQYPQEKKMQVLQALGITEDQVSDWMMYKTGILQPKDKVEVIKQMENPDFGQWYRDKIIQLDDLQEMERQGMIESADDMWDALKLTDPYYAKKATSKGASKYAKTVASYKKKLIKQKYSSVNAMLKEMSKRSSKKVKGFTSTTPKRPSIKAPSVTKYTNKIYKPKFKKL